LWACSQNYSEEGRSPFRFGDDSDDETCDSGDDDRSSPGDFEIRDALSRSNSDQLKALDSLEAEESWAELRSLARENMSEKPDGQPPKANSSQVDPKAVASLLQLVKSKMDKRLGYLAQTFDLVCCKRAMIICNSAHA